LGSQDSGIAAIAAQLMQTQSLIQSLISEIHKSSAAQATLNSELKQLRYNVQVLSNIIRGDDGHAKPLLSEVETLRYAGNHLEKRMSVLTKEMDEQMDELGNALSSTTDRLQKAIDAQRVSIEAKMDAESTQRRLDETQRLQLQFSDTQDLRLDKRQRLQTLATIMIAVISLIGTVFALFVKD